MLPGAGGCLSAAWVGYEAVFHCASMGGWGGQPFLPAVLPRVLVNPGAVNTGRPASTSACA